LANKVVERCGASGVAPHHRRSLKEMNNANTAFGMVLVVLGLTMTIVGSIPFLLMMLRDRNEPDKIQLFLNDIFMILSLGSYIIEHRGANRAAAAAVFGGIFLLVMGGVAMLV